MNSPLNDQWFTEICAECGSAFSMELKAKLHEEQTPYQRIEVFETKTFGTVMVIDGFVMLTERDNFIYHEMMAHPALFSHRKPTNVLIIGGGDCGTLREVLKHSEVETVRQVEIDERVTRVSERYFPELCEFNDDRRAEFHFADGIDWVKHTAPNTTQVIIVDSTDPIGPAAGLFSEDFYRDCHQALADGGIIVHQSESPLFHRKEIIEPMRHAFRRAGFQDIKTLHFPQCSYPSGWWTATMACKDKPIEFVREPAAQHKRFATKFYNAAIHHACSAIPEFLQPSLGD